MIIPIFYSAKRSTVRASVIILQVMNRILAGKSAIHLGRFMEEHNIYMIWSGHINSDVGNEVLSITETKLNEEDLEAVMRRRVFSILNGNA